MHRPLHRQGQRSVIVLSDDVWNDTLTLPLDVTVLLQPDELRQALAIEAENYSGVSAFQSRLAVRQLVYVSSNLVDVSSNLPKPSSWWVAQVSDQDLASIRAATDSCGVKLLGVTHPLACWRAAGSELPAAIDWQDQASLLEFGQHWPGRCRPMASICWWEPRQRFLHHSVWAGCNHPQLS